MSEERIEKDVDDGIEEKIIVDENERKIVERLKGIFLNKAIKFGRGWYIVKDIVGFGKYEHSKTTEMFTSGDYIYDKKTDQNLIVDYMMRCDHPCSFEVSENGELLEDECYIDESFEDIRDSVMEYIAKVSDQDGHDFYLKDDMVFIEGGKLVRGCIKGFDPETFEYKVYCYRSKEYVYRKGPEMLLVEYYGC